MKINRASFFAFVLLLVIAINFPLLALQYSLIGPEFYYAQRKKDGGTKQTGWLYGGRALYERRVPCGFYWAVDGYYAYGKLHGKGSSGSKLKSELTEKEIEGRLGYSFSLNPCKNITITPFGTYGYYCNKNKFVDPSPLEVTYHDSYQYGGGGISLSLPLTRCFTAELIFNAKYMFQAKSIVKDDPEYDDIKLIIENKMQYEASLPLRYATCLKGWKITIECAPFYRFRHFGERPNYPFDFIETKFQNYGVSLTAGVRY